jgi:autotransporter-associated beta strand protein
VGTGALQIKNGGQITSLASDQTASITNGSIVLGGPDFTFNVADGSVTDDLLITSRLSSGGLIKTGAGTLVLAPDSQIPDGFGDFLKSDFSGQAQVQQGILNIRTDDALGAATGLSSTGTLVSSGAQLQLQGSLNIGNEYLQLAGTGVDGTGALRSLSGDSTWGGPVNLSAAARIEADAGSSLTFNGLVSGSGLGLTIAGAGDTTLNATTTLNSLTKDGAGTLTLNANQNYVTANLNGGTTVLGASNILSNTMTVNLGAAGTLNVNGQTDTIAALTGSGTLQLATGGHLSVGAGDTSMTYSGTITGDGLLEKIGDGVLTFDTNLNFDGELRLAAGTLRMDAADVFIDTLRITGDSVLDFSGVSTLTVNNLYIESGVSVSIINWVENTDFFYASAFFDGTNTLADQDKQGQIPMNQITFDGYSNNQTIWLSYDDQITVPEPGTYGLAMLGGLLAWLNLRRRPRAV